MLRKIFFVFIGAIWLMGCSTSSQPATEITLEAKDLAYEPLSITVPVSQPVTLKIKNNGQVEHDFVIQKINVTNVVKQDSGMDMSHDMDDEEYDLHISVLPGESSTITFTPTLAGTYQYFCTVAGHKEAGMVGELIVTAQ